MRSRAPIRRHHLIERPLRPWTPRPVALEAQRHEHVVVPPLGVRVSYNIFINQIQDRKIQLVRFS